MATRSELLREYIRRTEGTIVRDDDRWGGFSPDLINDYLRFLTNDPGIHIPGHAIDWAITGEHLTPAANALCEIAEYTNAFPGRHAPVTLPDMGDVMVFSGPAGNPYGGLGIYVSHAAGDVKVFTQGRHDGQLAPAQLAVNPGNRVVALGWWRVYEHLIHHRRPAPWALNPTPGGTR